MPEVKLLGLSLVVDLYFLCRYEIRSLCGEFQLFEKNIIFTNCKFSSLEGDKINILPPKYIFTLFNTVRTIW